MLGGIMMITNVVTLDLAASNCGDIGIRPSFDFVCMSSSEHLATSSNEGLGQAIEVLQRMELSLSIKSDQHCRIVMRLMLIVISNLIRELQAHPSVEIPDGSLLHQFVLDA